MTERNNGGPAFPRAGSEIAYGQQDGMTLRDWFAGQALKGLMVRSWDVDGRGDAAVITQWGISAYAVADAMLSARDA